MVNKLKKIIDVQLNDINKKRQQCLKTHEHERILIEAKKTTKLQVTIINSKMTHAHQKIKRGANNSLFWIESYSFIQDPREVS